MATAFEADPARQKVLISEAVQNFELSNSGSWDDLMALSSKTVVDSVEVDPEGVTIKDKTFKGVVNVYVALEYDGLGKDDAFETSDAFPAYFEGHFDHEDKAVVDAVRIDTSSFYE